MAKKTTVKAGRTARCLSVVTLAAVVFTASARTVYDAGIALRQNCESGFYANPYTDANGGAFNGLTLVGDLPDYKSVCTAVFIR